VPRNQRFGVARASRLEERDSKVEKQLRSLALHIGLGQRELDALILADRIAEDDTLVGVFGALAREEAAAPSCRSSGENAVDGLQVLQADETTVELTDQAVGGNDDVLERHLRPAVIVHRLDRRYGKLTAVCRQVDQEDRQVVRAFAGAGDDQHQI
jgi:hypothetical protein